MVHIRLMVRYLGTHCWVQHGGLTVQELGQDLRIELGCSLGILQEAIHLLKCMVIVMIHGGFCGDNYIMVIIGISISSGSW